MVTMAVYKGNYEDIIMYGELTPNPNRLGVICNTFALNLPKEFRLYLTAI